MISDMPKKTLVFNEGDELPTVGIPDGQCALNKDTGECVIFDLPSKTWKKI